MGPAGWQRTSAAGIRAGCPTATTGGMAGLRPRRWKPDGPPLDLRIGLMIPGGPQKSVSAMGHDTRLEEQRRPGNRRVHGLRENPGPARRLELRRLPAGLRDLDAVVLQCRSDEQAAKTARPEEHYTVRACPGRRGMRLPAAKQPEEGGKPQHAEEGRGWRPFI